MNRHPVLSLEASQQSGLTEYPTYTSSKFDIHNSHPLQESANEYLQKPVYIDISSEDRNILKWPNSNEFEIFLPTPVLNIISAV